MRTVAACLSMLACCSGSEGYDLARECARASRSVGPDEVTPLGITASMVASVATMDHSAPTQLADRPPSTIIVSLRADPAGARYFQEKTVSPPGLDVADFCPEVLTVAGALTLRTTDGQLNTTDPVVITASKGGSVRAEQQLLLKGNGRGFSSAIRPTGTFEVPARMLADKDVAVARIAIDLPAGSGSIGVTGATYTSTAARRFATTPLASWPGR